MRFTTLCSLFALALGVNAAPKFLCGGDKTLAFFDVWNNQCSKETGRTINENVVYTSWTDLCLPLPDDARGLNIKELAEDCHSKCLSFYPCQ